LNKKKMSVIKGLWTNWKPVNEENNHGLDKQEIKEQVETIIGKVDVFVEFEYREYKVFSTVESFDIKSLQLVVRIKQGDHRSHGTLVTVHIEVFEGKHVVTRVENKLFPGLQNKLEVLDGEDKGKHLTFVDDYPSQSPFVPATKAIQKILNKVLDDNPSIPKCTAMSFACRILETGREYLVLAINNSPTTSIPENVRLLTIHGEGKTYTIDKEKIKDVPLDYSANSDNLDLKSIYVPDWQAMTKEVRDAAFVVKDKVCADLKDYNTYEPRRFRYIEHFSTGTMKLILQVEIKVKSNIVQGCRESFAPEGVVVVNVLKNDEKYDSISNLRIVPSNVNELIYYPTDWSLVIDNNHDVDKLVKIIYEPRKDINPKVSFWKFRCGASGLVVKALVDVTSQDDGSKMDNSKRDVPIRDLEFVEFICMPPFPDNEKIVVVKQYAVKFV